MISGLDVSHNRMSTLPAEVSSLTQLEKVDISHNSFVALPNCLFQAPRVTHIDAQKNFVSGTDCYKTKIIAVLYLRQV